MLARVPRTFARASHWLFLPLVALVNFACVDDALLVDPAKRLDDRAVPIALSLSGLAGGATEAYAAADEIHVLVIGFDAEGLSSTLVNETIGVTRDGGTIHASLHVPFEEERDSVQVVVTLMYQGSALFDGFAWGTLVEGASLPLTVTPQPVVHAVATSAAVATIDAVGDTLRVTGAALFATGDTIQGVPLTWTSLDETVATVDSTGLVTGVARGQTTIQASAAGIPSPSVALTVASVSQGPKSMAAGYTTTCGLTQTGAAYCWGSNIAGTLGTGGAYGSSVPVPVAGAQTYRSISGSWAHMCALDGNGAAWCWGENHYGQLGDGTTNAASTPVPVAGGIHFVALDTGWGATCGLDETGAAWCWGRNADDELGTSTPFGSTCGPNAIPCATTPVRVDGGLSFTQISAGIGYACAVDAGGVAYCWGSNDSGRLGDGTMTLRASPTPVNTAERFVEVETGTWNTCALTAAGVAWCWGQNTGGVLGIGVVDEAMQQHTPVQVVGGLEFRDLSLESDNNIITHACGITTDDDLYCWGWNSGGQIGSASATETCVFADGYSASCASSPVAVDGATDVAAVTLGIEYTCGVTVTTEEVYCWGYNFSGQLGDGTLTDRTTPTLIADELATDPVPTSAAVTPGSGNMAAPGAEIPLQVTVLDQSGNAMPGPYEITYADSAVLATSWTWRDSVGVVGADGGTTTMTIGLGAATQSATFTVAPPPPVQDANGIATGNLFACGVDTVGQAWCWGVNSPGTLGVGTDDLNPHGTPEAVQQGALSFVSVTSGGGDHMCALAADGRAYCWGAATTGQLGEIPPDTCVPHWDTGATVGCGMTPVQVNTYHRFVRLGGGHDVTCGVTALATTLCWGSNYAGQLGIGYSSGGLRQPQHVQTGLEFTDLAGSSTHMCGLATDGSAHCWGSHATGQLGVGTIGGNAPTPQPVVGGHTFADLAAGGAGYEGASFSCAIDGTGQAWCWGTNDSGQLGLNELTTTSSGTPVAVQQGALVFTAIAAGWNHVCALEADGTPYCWGSTPLGVLSAPTQMAATAFDAIATGGGGGHTCATTTAGAGYCWGPNGFGQLGDGTTIDSQTPVPVAGGITFR